MKEIYNNCCEYVIDCGDEVQPQYFTDLPTQTGESSLIIVQDIIGLDIGDEVGLFDLNGVLETDTTGTNPQYGETPVFLKLLKLLVFLKRKSEKWQRARKENEALN